MTSVDKLTFTAKSKVPSEQAGRDNLDKWAAVTSFKQMFRQYVVSHNVMCLLHSVQTYIVTACFEWRFRVLIHQVLGTARGGGMKLEPKQKQNQKNRAQVNTRQLRHFHGFI